jgi:nucleoporin SEH1
MNIPKKLTLN